MDAHVIYTVTRKPIPDGLTYDLPMLGTDVSGRAVTDEHSSIVCQLVADLRAREETVHALNVFTVVWTATHDLVVARCVWCRRTLPVMWMSSWGEHGLMCPVSAGGLVCKIRPILR